MCSSCALNFAPQPGGQCIPCTSELSVQAYSTLGVVIILVAGLAQVYRYLNSGLVGWLRKHPEAAQVFHSIKHKAKILLTLSQIVGEYPTLFSIQVRWLWSRTARAPCA